MLASLAEAYVGIGSSATAAAILGDQVHRITDWNLQRALRLRLGTILESLGSPAAAAAQYQLILSQTGDAEAQARLQAVKAQVIAAHRQQIAAQDDAAYTWAVQALHAARGTVSRDRALEKGIAEIQQPYLREQLLLEASRIEVDAVLKRVSQLKTKAAKIRNLQSAIDKIRTDDIPDELQAAEIAELERQLDQLEAR